MQEAGHQVGRRRLDDFYGRDRHDDGARDNSHGLQPRASHGIARVSAAHVLLRQRNHNLATACATVKI